MFVWVVLLACGVAGQVKEGPYPPAAQGPYPPAVQGPYPPAGVGGGQPFPGREDVPESLGETTPVESFPGGSGSPVGQEDTPANALPLPPNSKIKITDTRNQYTHGFNDQNSGISMSEQGSLLSTNEGWEYVLVKKGSYSYTSPEGIPVKVDYVADQDGFRVLGETFG